MSHRVFLFVYANTGGGHKASAQAVAREIAGRDKDFEVVLFDPTEVSFFQHPLRRILRGYGLIVRHIPALWSSIYRVSNRRPAFAMFRRIGRRTYAPAIAAEVARVSPDVVVGFHGYLASAIKDGAGDRPSALVVTDLESVHRYWLHEPFDRIVVPTNRVRTQAIEMGANAERLRVTGLPVNAGFSDTKRSESGVACLRAKLGLKQMFTVLVCGGGEGVGNLSQQVAAIAKTFDRLQIVAICGRNKRAFAEIEGLAVKYENITVHGFVDNMEEFLQASDVFVTKAGPGAIQEAANAGVPAILTGAIPGQEAKNFRCVVAAGAGSSVKNGKELTAAVGALLWNKSLLQERRDNMARLASPGATIAIADEICTLVPFSEKTRVKRFARPGRIAAVALVAAVVGLGGFAESDNAAALRAPGISAARDVTSDVVEAGHHIHHSHS